MTLLKKSLAMLLAFLMIFSSMSVAATAWTVNDDPNDITFTVKFFRNKSGEWVETTTAAPGEQVKARIYIKTGYYTTGGETALVFDKDFFGLVNFNETQKTNLTVNANYGSGKYDLTAYANWRSSANFAKWNYSFNMDYILEEIENDPDYFKAHDFLSSAINFGGSSTEKNSMLTDDDWMYEYDFAVADNATTNTIDESGEVKVPPYYCSIDRVYEDDWGDIIEAEMPINIPKGEAGKNKDSNQGMWLWAPEFYTNPGTLTTTSEIIFDMGLVDGNGKWDEETYTTQKGIIGKDADLNAVDNPTHPDGRVFQYWSTTKPGEGKTQEKVSSIAYDYDAVTLYAVWGEKPDVSYTLKEFYMNADGSYPTDVEGVVKSAAPDSTVSAPVSSDSRFTLDTTLSDMNVVVNADNSSVVNAYYIRNKYKLVYHYPSMTGDQTDDYLVRFGAALPAFGAGVDGEPVLTGYTFLGWTTVENGDEVETLPTEMPSEELHLYPIFEIGETYDFEFVFNAKEGQFSDGSNIKRYSYNYLQDVEIPENPTATGKRFVDWDDEIPTKADGDRTFEAIYEDILYTVTFVADTDEDGEYETTVATYSENFAYGDKLEARFAPENYPIDAWKLKDGTAVTISDGEDAYEVTGDVTLYTIGKDEYPARFYYSQEDLDNGAEPYKVIYVKYDTEIPMPEDPTKDGHTFITWEPDAEGNLMDSTEGKDYVAVFEANEITVTFNPNGGTCDVSSDSATFGESLATLPTPEKEGFEFVGWFTPDETLVEAPYEVPSGDIELKAEWKAEIHSITFVDTDGTQLDKIEKGTEEDIELPGNLNPPTKEGYEFTGWLDESGAAATVPEKMPAKDSVLYATWKKLSYDFTANANGGKFADGTDEITAEIPYGDALSVEQPTKEGYTFAGWAYADDESNTIITLDSKMPAKDISIKAVWTTNKHLVTYDANGGVFKNEDGTTSGVRFFKDVEYGTAIPTLNEIPTKDGFTFVRWAPEAPEAMPDSDLTFKAEWQKNPGNVEYKIYISYPNPSNPEETITKEVITSKALEGKTVEVIKEGETQTADIAHTYEEILEKSGVTFIEPDYDNRPDAITIVEGENKIDVSFNLVKYTVIFNANNGVITDENGVELEEIVIEDFYGQPINVPGDDALSRKGYDFTGWDKDPENTITGNAEYIATWEIQIHDVEFIIVDENGEEIDIIIESFEYDEKIQAPDYPVPDGYEFSGWDVGDDVMGEDDLAYTATLLPIAYTLTYEVTNLPEGATAPSKVAGLNVGDNVDVAAAEEVEGYEFDGWYDADGNEYFADGTDSFTMPAANVTLTGAYVAKEYTISFDSDGAESYDDIDVTYGEEIGELPTPTKEGNTFLGWYDGETKYEADTKMPAKDITLVAKWSELAYTVKYEYAGDVIPEGANAILPAEETVAHGDTVKVADKLVLSGYIFTGWLDEEGNEVTGEITVTNNIVLKGYWTENAPTYTLTIDADGGKFSNDESVYTVTGEQGTPVNKPSNPTKEGYEFNGWVDENGAATSIPDAIPGEDVTIKASWAELFDVTYYNEDGTVFDAIPDAAKAGETIPAPSGTPDKEGYTFTGWVDANGETVTVMPESDLALYPTFVEIVIPKFTVTYKNGDLIVKTVSYEEGEVIADYSLEDVEGKTFKGWNPELPSTMPAENLEVTAVWETNKHDITLNAGEGKFADDTNIFTDTVEYGTVLSDVIPAQPTREGYTFAGWDGELPATMPDNDVELNAVWEAKEYTITFDSNGGSEVPSQTYKYGEEVTPPAAPTREGFEFVKWNPELPSKMPANDITVVAEWNALVVTKTLTIDANGGKFEDGTNKKTQTLAVGEEIGTLPVPSKDGYEFAGWAGMPEDGKMPSEDITVTATWTEVVTPSHTIEYYLAVGGALYDTLTFEEGEAIVHPTDPTAEGLTFKGWYDEDGNELPAVMGKEDIKAYAKFDVNSYKVTYTVDGEVYAEYDVLYQAEVPVPADPADSATRLFAGWDPTPVSTMPAHDLEYAAKWINAPTEPNQYTATFLRHNGETHAKHVLEEGDAIPVPAGPQRFGYVFVGWEPSVPSTMPAHDMVFEPKYEVDKTFVAIVVGGTVVAGGVIAGSIIGSNIAAITGASIVGGILVIVGVAELVKHTHTVKYIVDGEVYKTYKVVEGTKIPVPADPAKDGFIFEGWNPEVPKKMGKEDLTFEATWSEKAVDDSTPSGDVDVDGVVDIEIPDTGSVAGGLAAFAVISGAAAAAYVITKRKKED